MISRASCVFEGDKKSERSLPPDGKREGEE